ncbi:hypothetical protein MUN78_09085 [Leucobacter allii]|uniref:Histidine kinase n=1 Tax=Leucobacter allii TaxID=2932247 RepID=A0ABY4FIW7_9MICO|nr:hypothetical protein [Leucobacter allii]UOQ55862.1 hypothetical protein MUN78_09085 [Leucobacter allii]
MVSSPADHPRSLAGWAALRVLLALESAFLAGVVVMTVIGAAGSAGSAGSMLQNVSLVVMAAVCLLWVVITLVGALRGRASWVRGSAVTVHVLLFAAGTGCLQIGIGPWWLGFALAAAALLGFLAAILAQPDTRTVAERAEAGE